MTESLAKTADHGRFSAETARFRRELLAHCYRMVGSAHDAQDLVQDAYLRAWRSYTAFEGRSSTRSWLYKIATNVCLTALEKRRGRALPSSLAWLNDNSDQPACGEVAWLEPFPDTWLAPTTEDPAATLVARESLRLALIATLQVLPARQRAIFILCDVVGFSAHDTAELLETTLVAVKSGLQRARAQLESSQHEAETLIEPTDPRGRQLLDGYIAAFERSDSSLLLQVLRSDATLEAPPFREWQAGRVNCIQLLETQVLGTLGDWRMIATTANGQPAAAAYRRDAQGVLKASDIVVLAATATGVARVIAFHDPRLVRMFGFPEHLAG